jgi:hypothetical protein
MNGEEMYLKVPDGFQKFYKKGVILKLERTIYTDSSKRLTPFGKSC